MIIGVMTGMSKPVYAEEGGEEGGEESTVVVKEAEVSSLSELEAALNDTTINCIIITQSFDVPCKTAEKNKPTSRLIVNRTMTIKGTSPDIKLTRTIDPGDPANGVAAASNGLLQSMIGVCGNKVEDGVILSLYDITLDGGAVFEGLSVMDRIDNETQITKQGACGRSLVDVYNKATLNLEAGLTIQNSYCSYSLASVRSDGDSTGSCNYGGGVRVDWDEETGGGTVNVKAGSCIRDCSVSSRAHSNGYGGGIGAYSFAHLNISGGLIEDCSAPRGGAIGCTNRAKYDPETAASFVMNGGTLRGCCAEYGGGISAYGRSDDEADPKEPYDYLLGGTIENCSAIYGGAVAFGEDRNNLPLITITPFSDGLLIINNCTSEQELPTDLYFGSIELQYPDIYIKNPSAVSESVHIDAVTKSITFYTDKDAEEKFTVLYTEQGTSLGNFFPGDPSSEYPFIGWNTKADGTGDTYTKTDIIDEDIVLYARWLYPPTVDESENLEITYGDADKSVSVTASAPYGGDFSYQWSTCKEDGTDASEIQGATEAAYNIPKQNAGTYYYKCIVTNSGNGKTVTTESDPIKVEIAPKTLTLEWSDTELTESDIAQKPKAEIVDGVLDEDDCQVEVTGEETKAGTYKATAKLIGEDSANYVIADENDFADFTIAAKPTPTPEPTPEATEEPTASPSADPSAQPTADPSAEPSATPGTDVDITAEIPFAENVSLEEKEKAILEENTDKNDVAGSTHIYLTPKASPKKTSMKLTWKKIKGADGYKIYGAKCGKQMQPIATVEGGSKKSYTVKKLKKGSYYKFVIVAYKNTSAGEKVITTSRSIHASTDGGKKGNPTSLKVKKSKLKIKKGKTAKIKASFKKKKKVATHIAKFRYESTDTSIATVNKKGKVKAVGKGKCKIYVYTQNGLTKMIPVTVK